MGGVLLGLIETFLSAYVSSAHKRYHRLFILLIFLFCETDRYANEQRAIMTDREEGI